MFRSAGAPAPRSSVPSGGATSSTTKEPPTNKVEAKVPSTNAAPVKEERPRMDTVALVEANAAKAREVPTWLAVIAIVALSLVAGMTTYLIRLKTAGDVPPAATASAEPGR
jgi:hypothetical protein